MTSDIYVIIMAAGAGTRMKSRLPKMLHKVCGRPIIDYILDGASAVSENSPIMVIGHEAQQLKEHVGDRAQYAKQDQLLGTGHAVMMAAPLLKDKKGYVVVLAGDTPLIREESLKAMVQYARDGSFDAVALSTVVNDSTGYGRIVRTEDGSFDKIVEHKDATEDERKIKEINASMYCFRIETLIESLNGLANDNAQGEYYLTDSLSVIKSQGKKVGIYCLDDYTEILGVNTRRQLSDAQRLMRDRINNFHMDNGVTLIDPDNTYIDATVTIGKDTTIYPGNIIQGSTDIGEGCILYPDNRIVDSTIGDGVISESTVILESKVEPDVNIGPFAYIRPGSCIGKGVKVGDFVEIKNAHIGAGTKISHLAYVGDATVGKNVNVGCGAIFVNYDGELKHRTEVGDNSFIGCNVNLVAPVSVGDNTFIAAGSTITEDIPEDALGIARARQTNKEKWVSRKRQNKVQK